MQLYRRRGGAPSAGRAGLRGSTRSPSTPADRRHPHAQTGVRHLGHHDARLGRRPGRLHSHRNSSFIVVQTSQYDRTPPLIDSAVGIVPPSCSSSSVSLTTGVVTRTEQG